MTLETEEGDTLFAVAYEAGEELDRAQKDQDRLQDELEFTREGLVTAYEELANCWTLHNADVNSTSADSNRRATHEATCASVKKASQRTACLKRTRAEANGKTRSHRESCSRITNGHTRSEAGAATHSPTCGVPDRESNEIRYLKQATELIEE